MDNKRNNNFPEIPEHFLTDKANAIALKIWKHLAAVYDGQNIDISASGQLLEVYCENSQAIELLTEKISKNLKERVDILSHMSDLQKLAGYISIQGGIAGELLLLRAVRNYEKRKDNKKSD